MPNPIMDELLTTELDKWREHFLSQYGEVRDAFKEFDQSSTRLLSLFFSLKFDTGIDAFGGGMLIDIGQRRDSRMITAVGVTFSKSISSLNVGFNLIAFSCNQEKSAGRLDFTGEKK